MTLLFVDIETAAPPLTPEANRALVKIDRRWKEDTVKAKLADPDVLRDARHRLATDPRRLIIAGVACAIDDRPAEWLPAADFFDLIIDARGPTLCGHGICGFDIPALAIAATRARHAASRVLWGIVRSKPWDRPAWDTLDASMLVSTFGKTAWSLDDLASMLGVRGPKPGTITGADCPAAFDDGRLDEIRAHGLDDVEREREVVIQASRAGIGTWSLPAWADSFATPAASPHPDATEEAA